MGDAAPRKAKDLSGEPAPEVAIDVGRDADGERLDTYLARRLHWRSRASVQALIESGQVVVDGRPGKKGERLRLGQRVTIRTPPCRDPIHHDQPITILYEDDDLFAVDKPAGMVCHPVHRHLVNTLINVLHYRYRRPDDPARDVVPLLCHRLDAETSGVILVAKSSAIRRRMQDAFEARKVKKTYLAIVEGVVPEDRGCIDLPIGRNPLTRCEMMVRPDGAPAHTHFEVIERLGDATFLRLEPLTGRQHQLRVHLAAAGHPILGDPFYGSTRRAPRTGIPPGLPPAGPAAGGKPGAWHLPSEAPAEAAEVATIEDAGDDDEVDMTDDELPLAPPPPSSLRLPDAAVRQALHAESLTFRHPRTRALVLVRAPLPADLAAEIRRRAGPRGELSP